ncbi:MAG: ABC transporter permease [Phycisphaerales bacterium]|nr:ABC transporter permease [Phycisphaerales bacterium]
MASSATSIAGDGRVRRLTPEPTAWSHLLSPLVMFLSLWSHRSLIRQFAARDIRGRTRGTRMGVFWSILGPILQLVVFTIVFSTVLEGRLSGRPDETRIEFAILLFAGLMVFGIFADPLGQAPNLVVGRRNMVKRVVFPLEILSVSSVLAALFYSSLGLLVAWLIWVIHQGEVHATVLLTPIVLLPGILCVLGLSWILAALGVFVRDLNQVVAMFVQRLLFFATPIFYSLEIVPAQFRIVLYFNPMTPVVDGVRSVAMFGEQPMWWLLNIWLVAGAVLCIVGYALFQRARGGFADVI